MKCHNCFKELEYKDGKFYCGELSTVFLSLAPGENTCHISIRMFNDEIIGYVMFFNKSISDNNYRIWSYKPTKETLIRKYVIDEDHPEFDGWDIIMGMDVFIPIEISSDGIIQKSILNRLLNLKVYA